MITSCSLGGTSIRRPRESKPAAKAGAGAVQSSISGWLGLAAVLGTLIYTALGTRAATRAAEAAENTLEDMQDTSQRELRAYVFVESAFINNAINARPNPGELQVPISDARVTHPNEGPLAVLHLKNFGRTPAHDVVHLSAMFVREFPLADTIPGRVRRPPLGRVSLHARPHGVTTDLTLCEEGNQTDHRPRPQPRRTARA